MTNTRGDVVLIATLPRTHRLEARACDQYYQDPCLIWITKIRLPVATLAEKTNVVFRNEFETFKNEILNMLKSIFRYSVNERLITDGLYCYKAWFLESDAGVSIAELFWGSGALRETWIMLNMILLSISAIISQRELWWVRKWYWVRPNNV